MVETENKDNTEMDVVEKPMKWLKNFNLKWLAHFEKTGEIDWKKYQRPRNRFSPSGLPITLSESKLMLISSSGAYMPESQSPFEQDNMLGDYSHRIIPSDTKFDDIKFAHTHYDHQFINENPQVLLPLRHMEDLIEEGFIGELAPITLSFSGYQPNVIRVIKELIPSILEVVKDLSIDGVILVPS
jgi:hypothetical protein